ncbi:hypothetical protein OV079_15190 [Nannocystis pusilla]|uniref:Uncharacterized protein n=1 Tax=Nannocystis pusilla TaxID=889268 RepID=A0A9X3EMQ1_9BACT|nr:hypothetical protein [Nannocystis pusilla]MCY1006874.1 hypothetical protein [Nannocystis pusilla]
MRLAGSAGLSAGPASSASPSSTASTSWVEIPTWATSSRSSGPSSRTLRIQLHTQASIAASAGSAASTASRSACLSGQLGHARRQVVQGQRRVRARQRLPLHHRQRASEHPENDANAIVPSVLAKNTSSSGSNTPRMSAVTMTAIVDKAAQIARIFARRRRSSRRVSIAAASRW